MRVRCSNCKSDIESDRCMIHTPDGKHLCIVCLKEWSPADFGSEAPGNALLSEVREALEMLMSFVESDTIEITLYGNDGYRRPTGYKRSGCD